MACVGVQAASVRARTRDEELTQLFALLDLFMSLKKHLN